MKFNPEHQKMYFSLQKSNNFHEIKRLINSFIGIAILGYMLMPFSASSKQRKAPSYPLITHNTYFSIWSNTDKLAESTTTHWTGAAQSLIGLINVDGTDYRFLGKEPEQYNTILPASDEKIYGVKYTFTQPEGNWTNAQYPATDWKEGMSPIGDNSGDNLKWTTKDIWIRRTFTIAQADDINQLLLKLSWDDDVEVSLNGEQIFSRVGVSKGFEMMPVENSKLKVGANVLAMHVVNTGGGSRADIGLVDKEKPAISKELQVADQKNVIVNATQTIYNFTCGKVDLDVTFTSPLLLSDLNLLSRPVSYITYKVVANDGKTHNVKVFFSASTDLAVNQSTQPVTASKYSTAALSILKAGTDEQPILQKAGDDVRIDWGYVYVAAPKTTAVSQFITSQKEAVDAFRKGENESTITKGTQLALNTVIPFGKVSGVAISKFIEIGYDDIYSMQYFKQNLRPWWNLSGKETMEGQLTKAATEYPVILQKCNTFNKTMNADAVKAGGKDYAQLCALAYRQSISAHILLKSPQGEILFFSKENHSGGFLIQLT